MTVRYKELHFTNKETEAQRVGKELGLYSTSNQWTLYLIEYGLWELDYKESWVPMNWCFSTVVLEKTFESPLDCKEIRPVNPKGNKSWIFIGRTDVEADTPILWPPDVKNWLTGKDPDPGKDWRQEEKGMTEDEMVGWHHQLNGHEFEYLQELVMDREACRAAVHGVTKSLTRLGDWPELNWRACILHLGHLVGNPSITTYWVT